MRHPPLPQLFAPGRRRLVLSLLALAVLALGLATSPFIDTMEERGTGIIEFELAGSSERAREIVSEWGEEGRNAARTSLILDYPFLLAYGLLLAGACGVVAERAGRLGRNGPARAGVLLAWAALAAAAADAVENVGLLFAASEHTAQPWPGLALTFALVKFGLLIPALLYALVGWLATRRGRR